MSQHHADFRHDAVIHVVGVLLAHPPEAVRKQQALVVIQEVVVGRVAVRLDPEGDLFAAIASGDEASERVEAAVGLLEVEDEAFAESGLVVDIHRAAQAAAIVGSATPPLQVDIVDQKHGDGAEVHLSERGCVELETIPKHEGMAGGGASERSR